MPIAARMTDSRLIGAGDLDAVFANVGGALLSRRQYIADAAALAERLPHAGAMLNLSTDRYRFAVGLGARAAARPHQPAAAEPRRRHGGAAARAFRRRLCAGRRRRR